MCVCVCQSDDEWDGDRDSLVVNVMGCWTAGDGWLLGRVMDRYNFSSV